ncbi:MAG: hypothetical protein JW863_08475 [Chitinispirillaceae bacterium]|nr:hypothetical protein [Chitinispirillaceae bacterium]
MAAERTRAISRHYLEYLQKKTRGTEYPKKDIAPVQAMMFDHVELSSPPDKDSSDYQWLTNYISELSDEEVSRKMKQFRNSYSTVDEACTDKIMMELL